MSNGRLAVSMTPSCVMGGESARVRWIDPSGAHDRPQSQAWCAAIGPPAIASYAPTDESRTHTLTIVSWNTHVGGGDIGRLASDLRTGRLTGQPATTFVLLLQEVYRRGDLVPEPAPPGARSAGPVRNAPAADPARDIESLARALRLNLFYVPSMRNGRSVPEDRGNAVLSTLPLDDFTAIELPLERQRRVAVGATVRLDRTDGRAIRIRVISAHLTNTVAHQAWVFSEFGRTRQARALARSIDGDLTILGADLNTWFGAWDGAYREVARVATVPPDGDRRPTFLFLRLDHFFYRLPDSFRLSVRRAGDRYGSDHYPLIGELRLPL